MNDFYVITPTDNDLYHHGILGQKWGKQNGPPYPLGSGDHSSAEKKAGWRHSLRKKHRSTSIMGALARRKNEKIDKSFEKWKKSDEARDRAIESGKRANEARINYENNKSKDTKKSYKEANKQYKRDLRKNTTYRKGTVRQEVESDLSRKYLSKARGIENELRNNPNDKILKKQYNKALTKHDVYRDKARKEQAKAAAKSEYIAKVKRNVTNSINGIAIIVAISAAHSGAEWYKNHKTGAKYFSDIVGSVGKSSGLNTVKGGFTPGFKYASKGLSTLRKVRKMV